MERSLNIRSPNCHGLHLASFTNLEKPYPASVDIRLLKPELEESKNIQFGRNTDIIWTNTCIPSQVVIGVGHRHLHILALLFFLICLSLHIKLVLVYSREGLGDAMEPRTVSGSKSMFTSPDFWLSSRTVTPQLPSLGCFTATSNSKLSHSESSFHKNLHPLLNFC